jgi:hypothetical protein
MYCAHLENNASSEGLGGFMPDALLALVGSKYHNILLAFTVFVLTVLSPLKLLLFNMIFPFPSIPFTIPTCPYCGSVLLFITAMLPTVGVWELINAFLSLIGSKKRLASDTPALLK